MQASMDDGKNYYRIMLGAKNKHAQQCYEECWFGGGWKIDRDLTDDLTDDWRDFNAKYRSVYMEANPGKSKIAAGLACGMLHTICKGIQQGDIVLCPDGLGNYWAGEVVSSYFYQPGEPLPHRRRVEWLQKSIARADMSEPLQNSTGSLGTVSCISRHSDEINSLLADNTPTGLSPTDDPVEDQTAFALEKHLEDFLVQNWQKTNLGQSYDIFEDGNLTGQQYPTDTGPIDILAIRKDKKELLVVELKRGRTSDVVVGQILRYMGYVRDELAEPDQSVQGCIIALEDDPRIYRALRTISHIKFFRYKIDFNLYESDASS